MTNNTGLVIDTSEETLSNQLRETFLDQITQTTTLSGVVEQGTELYSQRNDVIYNRPQAPVPIQVSPREQLQNEIYNEIRGQLRQRRSAIIAPLLPDQIYNEMSLRHERRLIPWLTESNEHIDYPILEPLQIDPYDVNENESNIDENDIYDSYFNRESEQKSPLDYSSGYGSDSTTLCENYPLDYYNFPIR
jgi:hypothetical protein